MELPASKPVICPTIVGRAAELAALHVIVREVEVGQSRIVLLSGEAGIGKSRLLRRLKLTQAPRVFWHFRGTAFNGT